MCSDGFSAFQDPSESKELNNTLRSLLQPIFLVNLYITYFLNIFRSSFKLLLEKLIPSFAPQFEKLVASAFAVEALEPGAISFSIGRTLHQQGINIRYLGKLRVYVKEERANRLLLIEMAARTIKRLIRAEMRKRMKELKFPLGPLNRLSSIYLLLNIFII